MTLSRRKQVIRRIGQLNNRTGLTRQGSSVRDFPPTGFFILLQLYAALFAKKDNLQTNIALTQMLTLAANPNTLVLHLDGLNHHR